MPSLIRAAALLQEVIDIMQITIGSTSDDRRKLTKSFSGVNIQAQLKEPCDILNPVFVVSYHVDYLTANYLYAPEFNRYYFVNNITVLPGKRIEISGNVDVLMSYHNEIKSLSCNIKRNANLKSDYISDDSKILTTATQTQTYVFDADSFVRADGFVDYVLTVIGGASSGS